MDDETMTLDELRDSVRQAQAEGRACTCTGTDEQPWNPACPIHTVGHFHKPGCCDQPEDDHRHMTDAEFDVAFPLLYSVTFPAGDHRYKIDARRYWSGVGCGIVRLFPDSDDAGLAFDFAGADLAAIAAHLAGMAFALVDAID